MWTERRGDWAQKLIDINDAVKKGELIEGSPEHARRMLVPYNIMAKTSAMKGEITKMILSDAVAGYSNLDESGQPLPPGTPPRTIRFEDLIGKEFRETFWNATLSSSYKKIKDEGILAETAQRDAGVAKRKSIDGTRDKQAGLYAVLGYGDSDVADRYLPYEDGTVNYHAEERAVEKWAKPTLAKANKVIANFNPADPNNKVSRQDYEVAMEQKRLAEMIIAGKSANPLEAKIQAKINEPIDQAVRDKYKSDDFPDPTDAEIREIRRGEVMRESRSAFNAKYADKIKNGSLSHDDIVGMSDEEFAMYQLQKTQEGAKDWYDGKNEAEVAAILGKRNLWSTANANGITVTKLVAAAEGQDDSERKRLFENVLMFGPDQVVNDYATNDHMRREFTWPDEATLRKINLVRMAEGKAPLPVNPFPTVE